MPSCTYDARNATSVDLCLLPVLLYSKKFILRVNNFIANILCFHEVQKKFRNYGMIGNRRYTLFH